MLQQVASYLLHQPAGVASETGPRFFILYLLELIQGKT